MTDHRHGVGAGSSLFQARKAHLHQHQRRSTHRVNRRQLHNNDSENSRPRDSPSTAGDSELAPPSDQEQLLKKPRQAELLDAALPAVADVTIVQTVSVVEYLDDAGATTRVETLASPPVTPGPTEPSPAPQAIPPAPEPTLDLPVPLPLPPTPSQDDGGAGIPQTEPAVPAETESNGPQPPVTSAPSPTASPPAFAPPSGFNSTSSGVAPHFNNGTLSAHSFTNSSSTASFRALSSISESDSLTETLTSTSTSDIITSLSNPTDLSNPGFNPPGIPGPQPPSSTTISPAAGPATPDTPTSTVVASVVGSVAGLALIVVAALLLLRYRRRRPDHDLPGESGTRALPAASDPSNPSGGAAATPMSERRHSALPFAIPATLAALTRGPKRLSSVPEPSVAHSAPAGASAAGAGASQERGFYRVSGKKLPSVMAHGGDGFTDPRQSTFSGTSSVYRDSTDMISRIGAGGAAGTARFAVGSPMRPESGIPVFQPGPARTPVRTPVTAEGPNPFDDVHELSPPRRQDGVGRSLVGEDSSRGSRGSGSRFHEHVG